jgi:hypothetical protein
MIDLILGLLALAVGTCTVLGRQDRRQPQATFWTGRDPAMAWIALVGILAPVKAFE